MVFALKRRFLRIVIIVLITFYVICSIGTIISVYRSSSSLYGGDAAAGKKLLHRVYPKPSETSDVVNVSSSASDIIDQREEDVSQREVIKRKGKGLSACLLVKDDNDRLPEWLAYHYHVLPLRHLVVAVDPNSITSPRNILERYNGTERNKIMGMGMMNIDLWENDWFLPPKWRGVMDPQSDKDHVRERHKMRQKKFLQYCMKHHKMHNRTWTILVDTDEYVLFNSVKQDDLKLVDRGRQEEKDEKNKTGGEVVAQSLAEQLMEARIRAPRNMGGNITIEDFIESERNRPPWALDACIIMPRLFFSAVEKKRPALVTMTKNESIMARAGGDDDGGAFLELDLTRLDTQRFFSHAIEGKMEYNGWAKPIIDLSRIPDESLKQMAKNPHRPLAKECKRAFTRYEEAVLRVNHYLGSWESYSSRPDTRRSKEAFDKKSSVNKGQNFDIQPWLNSFVQSVGITTAKELLRDAGKYEINLNAANANANAEPKSIQQRANNVNVSSVSVSLR